MAKAILRRRAVEQLVAAIKRDLSSQPKTSTIARRSVKVLDYMRGYIAAVDEELTLAVDEYETAVYHEKAALVEPPKRKSSLGRRTANGTQA
jgi:hypothetical protein